MSTTPANCPATRPARHHDMKSLPEPFEAVERGIKRHELRVDDRDVQEGDTVTLHKWSEPEGFSGQKMTFKVGWVSRGGAWGVPDGMCTFSLLELDAPASLPSIDPQVRLIRHALDEGMRVARGGSPERLAQACEAGIEAMSTVVSRGAFVEALARHMERILLRSNRVAVGWRDVARSAGIVPAAGRSAQGAAESAPVREDATHPAST